MKMSSKLFKFSGETMGTRYGVQAYGKLTDGLANDVHQAVSEVDRQMTTWNNASQLMQLNATMVDEWRDLPSEICKVLAYAQFVQTESNGTFNIGVGKAVQRWGFGTGAHNFDDAKLIAALNHNSTKLSNCFEVEGKRARRIQDTQLDLSAIAKGFGVDEMIRVLKVHGIENAIASIDGEVRVIGDDQGEGWAIAIEAPLVGIRDIHGMIALSDCAVATSGDYRHFHDINGTRIGHSIDPNNARPTQSQLVSVTVIANTCMEADAWATALMVMGDIEGPAFARAHDITALFLTKAQDGLIVEVGVGSIFSQ